MPVRVCSVAGVCDGDACGDGCVGGATPWGAGGERTCASVDDASQDNQNQNKTDTKHGGGGFVVRHATVCYIQPRDASVNMEGSEWVRCVNSDFPRCSCSF